MAIITDSHWVATFISILFYELFRELSEAKSNYFFSVTISVFFIYGFIYWLYFCITSFFIKLY